CDQENNQNWLECDVDDPGHQVLTDDEIIASAIDDLDLCDEEEEPSDENCAEKGPSNEEAFHCLETAMKWVEQQEECDAVQLLCFKRLRDLAAKSNKDKMEQDFDMDVYVRLVKQKRKMAIFCAIFAKNTLIFGEHFYYSH
ncbi:hypothetical protein C0J52_09618, partial [Blattella germanica]